MCLSIEVRKPEIVVAGGESLGLKWRVTMPHGVYYCGYVRVDRGHPWFGLNMEDVPAEVHGGITFSKADVSCPGVGKDDGWWVGFDHCHGSDIIARAEGNYVTEEEVIAEVRELCHQASLVSFGNTSSAEEIIQIDCGDASDGSSSAISEGDFIRTIINQSIRDERAIKDSYFSSNIEGRAGKSVIEAENI